MASPVLDHFWTQDNLISPLDSGGKLGPYIDQARSKLGFEIWIKFQNQNERLLNVERVCIYVCVFAYLKQIGTSFN